MPGGHHDDTAMIYEETGRDGLHIANKEHVEAMVLDAPHSPSTTPSSEPPLGGQNPPLLSDDFYPPGQRQTPLATSFLRSGSRFVGTQQSGRSTYEVSVDLKYVDFRESRLCGYLCIQGLTEDNPSLTTYFEGEIIGPKYSFLTKRPEWGATEKTDLQHWARFASWRPLAKQARKPDFCYKSFASKEHIYMRWKECFLVPDHRVSSISGASFAGFYYVCFNQATGNVSGLYYHQSSEKYQQLELSHVNTRGVNPAFELR